MTENLIFILVHVVLAAIALFRLRRQEMNEIAQVIWALFVVLAPIVGSLSLFVVNPGK